MSFLFPAMLAGLAGLSVPVIMHLIARHKFPVLDFPSLRLLEREDRTNVLAMKLVDPLQLLLRLLVLLLLVLAMSRLFLPWLHPAGHKSAPRNLVVVIDQSASMTMEVKGPGGVTTTLLDLAKERAKELIGQVDDASRSAIIGAAGQPETLSALRPGSRDALAVLDGIKPIDGTGAGLVAAVARARDLVRGRREVASQIVVFTDLRASSIDARNQLDLARITAAHDDLGSEMKIIFVDVAGSAKDNVAIVDATVSGGSVKVGDDAHIVATLLNSSPKEATAKLRLAVGDRKEPLIREIKIAPGGKAVVDMTTRVNRAVRTFAQVSVEPDALPIDDSFSVPLNVNDSRRVLVVSGGAETSSGGSGGGGSAGPGRVSAAGAALLGGSPTSKPAPGNAQPETSSMDGATIFRFVLNPGRELGLAYGTGIDTTAVTTEALAGQPLSKYDLIVLYDVSTLTEPVMKDLDVFVHEGKSLLIVASGGVSAAKFNQSLAVASGDRAALSPLQLGNDRDAEPAVGISLPTGSDSQQAQDLLAPFRDRLQGDLSVVRFNKLRTLTGSNPNATNMIVGTDGQPLAVETTLGQGKIMLLAFGFELDRGNLARTLAFPALMWRLLDHLTGRLKPHPQDILTALRPAVLDVSEPTWMLANELELESAMPVAKTQPAEGTVPGEKDAKPQAAGSAPRILPVREDRTVLLDGLPAGRYLLHKPRPKNDPTQIINYSRYITVQADPRESDMTRADQPQLTTVFGPGVQVHDATKPLDLSVPGGELWSLLIIMLAVAYAVEAVVGFILSSRRERERAAGDTGWVEEDAKPRAAAPGIGGVGA